MLIIGLLMALALYKGIDGVALSASLSIIGGLAGFGITKAVIKK